METTLEDIKANIRSILASANRPLSPDQLQKDYRVICANQYAIKMYNFFFNFVSENQWRTNLLWNVWI